MTVATNVFPLEDPRAEQTEGYYTWVDGVGYIPRDIYKYVESNPMGDLPRYSAHIVIQHFLMFVTFIILAATGMPLYFSQLFWSPYLAAVFGGIDTAMVVHRFAAMGMILTCLYHLATVIGGSFLKFLRNDFDLKRTQIPRLKDVKDLIDDLRYFLGWTPFRPKMEKFMYKQKLHYLAIIWGTSVLIAAGSALLFPDIMAKWFPEKMESLLPHAILEGDQLPTLFQDIARLMHADEAVMALLVLAFWHWTNVHLVPGRFPLQWTFLTGKITREHQIEEHFLEYINNLRDMPEERAYMRELLRKLRAQSQVKAQLTDLVRIH